MELDEAIKTRRSVRIFKDKPVENQKLMKIIEAGNSAPSYCNTQAWRFIVIEDKSIIERIVQADAAVYLKKAPICIVVLYDRRSDNPEYEDYIQSAAACVQNMLLTAHSLGIGSCWTCHLPRKKELQKILGIPWHYEPITILPFGYNKQKVKDVPRKHQIEQLISYNKFNLKEKIPRKTLGLRLKRALRKMYYFLPFRQSIRKRINRLFERRFSSKEAYEE